MAVEQVERATSAVCYQPKIQLPHIIVNLLFTVTNENVKLTIFMRELTLKSGQEPRSPRILERIPVIPKMVGHRFRFFLWDVAPRKSDFACAFTLSRVRDREIEIKKER